MYIIDFSCGYNRMIFGRRRRCVGLDLVLFGMSWELELELEFGVELELELELELEIV